MKIACILLCPCALLVGCASSTANYSFIYLKTGPEPAHKTPEVSKTIFHGHMANMSRLASEKKLVIAGPFNKPADATWRGIFILDVASLDRAREIVSTDPGIQSGVFIQEAHPFAASPALRRTFELEKKFNAARAANPTEPPTNIRAYVMMTATDGARAAVAIKASTLSTALIFCGTHTDTRAGVFVLDFESVAEVHALIAKEDIDLGPCVVDGWWSTTSLTGLAPAGR